MKLKIKKVNAKNFLSIGSNEVEFDYESGIHAVIGKPILEGTTNGVGKSTLFSDAITFGLYGKCMKDLKVNEVLNSIVQEKCVVKVWFEANGVDYMVERGIKPGFLRIFKEDNEEPEEYGGKKETQYKLESILGVAYGSFINMISLNTNSSTPFFRMTALEKRQLLEDIMNLSVYGKMFEICKKEYNESRQLKKVLTVEYKLLRDNTKELIEKYKKIDKYKKEFEVKKQNDIQASQHKIEILTTKLDELTQKLDHKDYNDLMSKIKSKRSEVNEKKIKISSSMSTSINEIKRLTKRIADIEANPVCPICSTETTSEHVIEHINDLKQEIKKQEALVDKYNNYKVKIEAALKELGSKADKVEALKDDVDEAKREISNISKDISYEENTLKNIENRSLDIGEIISKNEVLNSKKKLQIKKNELDAETINMTYGSHLKNVLGDKGIKNYVIRKILPVLNTKMNEYLQMMKASYSILFDENLSEQIKYRACDTLSYNNCSSGEQKRIDLALMFTLLDIAKARSSVDCNVLVLDEVLDSSMCSDGVNCLMDFLRGKFKTKHPDLCTYVITHRPEIKEDNFDSIVVIEKENSFTKVAEIRKSIPTVIQV